MNKETSKLKSNFDIMRYLEDRGIACSTEGDNVGDGWIGIECLFCDDHANHMGINLESGNYSCWLCSADGGGDLIALVRKIEGCGFQRACKVMEEYQEGLALRPKKKERSKYTGEILPKHAKPIEEGKEPPLVKHWFKKRGFPLDLCQEHNLMYVTRGEYKMLLVIPVYLKERLMSFQAADMTGKASIPYIDCPENRALSPNKHLLYGADEVEGEVVTVVEGVTDKWRMGSNSVALFGKNYTWEQAVLLYRLFQGKRVRVLFDADAVDKARVFALHLATHFDIVDLVQLDQGDPADLSQAEVDIMSPLSHIGKGL